MKSTRSPLLHSLSKSEFGSRFAARCAVLGLISLSSLAVAAPVTVPDFSFESPVTSGFQDNSSLAVGNPIPNTSPANAWYLLATTTGGGSPVGVENTAANGAETGVLGSQNGYVNKGAALGSGSLLTIAANTTYTLTLAEAARSNGFNQTSGFTIALAFWLDSRKHDAC